MESQNTRSTVGLACATPVHPQQRGGQTPSKDLPPHPPAGPHVHTYVIATSHRHLVPENNIVLPLCSPRVPLLERCIPRPAHSKSAHSPACPSFLHSVGSGFIFQGHTGHDVWYVSLPILKPRLKHTAPRLASTCCRNSVGLSYQMLSPQGLRQPIPLYP